MAMKVLGHRKPCSGAVRPSHITLLIAKPLLVDSFTVSALSPFTACSLSPPPFTHRFTPPPSPFTLATPLHMQSVKGFS